jgi:hydroxymethylbilane synthase
MTTVTIGTRGSALARRQTDLILQRLTASYPKIDFRVRVVETRGDRVQDRPVSEIGDKAVFVGAIEDALLAGEIDLAVHSLKDLPSDEERPELVLAAFSPRADPRDVLVSREGCLLAELPAGARVGTSSLRRRAQLMAARPDVSACDIRGNVDTRLRKLAEGSYDAVILAAAGLDRLGRGEEITEYLPVELFVPDAGQGIIAVQGRAGDAATGLAQAIDEHRSRVVAAAERTVVRTLGADCRSPVGAHAMLTSDRLRMLGMTANEDGSDLRRAEVEGPIDRGEELGRKLALELSRGSVSGP